MWHLTGIKFLHVFARTHNAPYKFFYRTWNEYMKWSAWEKVSLDIRSVENRYNSGVHLIPIVWKKRLFLFCSGGCSPNSHTACVRMILSQAVMFAELLLQNQRFCLAPPNIPLTRWPVSQAHLPHQENTNIPKIHIWYIHML